MKDKSKIHVTDEEIIKASTEHLIVALDDLDSLAEVKKMVRQLKKYVHIFKVGLELINKYGGPKVVGVIHDLGGKVFYDGKFNDKPSVLKRTAKLVSDLGVFMMSVHASAGREAMSETMKGVREGKSGDITRVLGVTILTSLEAQNARYIFGASVEAKVLDLAEEVTLTDVHGVICSPLELSLLKGFYKIKVTPGIRPSWYFGKNITTRDDQERWMQPYAAIREGSDYLVVGGPILKPCKEVGTSLNAVRIIGADIALALKEKNK